MLRRLARLLWRLSKRWRLYFWHTLANALALEPKRALAQPYVIDGDTIDDRATGVRYRLANIDAPETGDKARCGRERGQGELARHAAIKLVSEAKVVAVERTWRWDTYGRRVAFVFVDGKDLGELLMARGLARPWRGVRHRWCGRNGGLAKLARRTGARFDCQTCRAWRQLFRSPRRS